MNTQVLYFTGTGNSRFAARSIAGALGTAPIDMGSRIRRGNTQPIDGEQLVFVVPTYAWRMPRIVTAWIRQTPFPSAQRAWFVLTCGGSIGNAARYNAQLCRKKGWQHMGTAPVVMPENYVAMFPVPDAAQAAAIHVKAAPSIETAGRWISEARPFPTPAIRLNDRFLSTAVNPIFYRFFVKAKAFTVDARCSGCGKCVSLCPLQNIRLENGRPVWGSRCTHCMACICACPREAVEYGRKSVGKPRYYLA